mgnify:CR=1 FL=1
MLIDDQVAGIVLGFKQVDAAGPVDDQVVDLRDIPINDKAKIVQQDVLLVPEIAVEVVGLVTLPLHALLQAHQFIAKPLLLSRIQQRRSLQFLQQR